MRAGGASGERAMRRSIEGRVRCDHRRRGSRITWLPAGTTRFPRAGRCGAHPMGRWGSVLSVVDGGRLLIDREQRGCEGMAIKRQVLRAEVEELILERLLESRWSPGSRLSIDGLARDLEEIGRAHV